MPVLNKTEGELRWTFLARINELKGVGGRGGGEGKGIDADGRVDESENESFLAPLCRKKDKVFWLFLCKVLEAKAIYEIFRSR